MFILKSIINFCPWAGGGGGHHDGTSMDSDHFHFFISTTLLWSTFICDWANNYDSFTK